MFVVIYFLMIRPQSVQRKQHQSLLDNLKKGDKIAELHLVEGDNTRVKNVYSGKDIEKVSRFYRSFSIINYLLFGVSNKDN